MCRLQPGFCLLFERNPLPMWVCERQTERMLAVNQAALSRYGYSREQFMGLTLRDLLGDDGAAPWAAQRELQDDATAARGIVLHRSGERIEVDLVGEDLDFGGLEARLMLVRELTDLRRAERRQRELAQRLLSTLESITDAFFTLDRDWRFTYLNPQAQELLRRSSNELVGFNIWERFPQARGSIFQHEYERAVRENIRVSFETFYAPLALWLTVDAYPSAQGLAVYFRDVNEKHLAEQRLLEEREMLAAVIDAATDAIISVDAEGRIRMFNPAAERIFGYKRARVLGQPVELLLPERYRAAHPAHRERFSESGSPHRVMGLGRVKGLRADGQEIDLEGSLSQVRVLDQRFTMASMRDVTESLVIQAEFHHSRALLSELTHKLMTQEKVLVKRLAQVLHDQLGQTMAAIRMCHETIMTLQRNGASTGIDRHEAQLSALINQAIREIRQVLVDLRPPLLDEQGLAAALDNELRNRAFTRPEIDISIHIPSELERVRWPAEVEYAIFMIAREAIENALRHSGASSVSICLAGSTSSVELEVADNGVGFKTGGSKLGAGHLGILGMRERAHAIAATVRVDSAEASGTRVSCHWSSSS